MKTSDVFRLALENLRRRMGRTTLTTIGVVVGICSILVMMSFGIAMNDNFAKTLEQWADLTVIQVYNWGNNGDTPALDDAMVEQIAQIDHVSIATPQYYMQNVSGRVILETETGRYRVDYADICGMYTDAIEALDIELSEGSYLRSNNKRGTVSVLVGQYTGYNFYDTKKKGEGAYRWQGMTDPAGNELPPFVDVMDDPIILKLEKPEGEEGGKTLTYRVDVCGVMKEDVKKGYYTYGGILMDLDTVKMLEKEYMKANGIRTPQQTQGYNDVYVKVDDIDNVAAVNKAIKDLGYDTYSMDTERENMQKQALMLQLVFGGLGAVSLFVAALSIANTMTMAIYERTREIGVMKVLGCGIGKIRQMFLMEAGFIGFAGGVIGIVLSYIISFVLNFFAPSLSQAMNGSMFSFGYFGDGSVISTIPPWLALLGLLFATIIGVVSGIMPARRAVKISALEAIRHE